MEWETPIDRMLRERAGKKPVKKVEVALSEEIEELLAARRVIMPNPQRGQLSAGMLKNTWRRTAE